MITIKRYDPSEYEKWNDFNLVSKNSLFMFDRRYMDYHSNRFRDHSLLFYRDAEVIAILPMSQHDNVVISHGGLTYGGFISGIEMKQHIMEECFDELIVYARDNSISSIRYKAIPHIYHRQPAEEDRYSLFSHGGRIVSIDASTYLDLSNPIKMPKGRKAQISRAKREGVIVRECDDSESYRLFIELENDVLEKRHNTRAVHSAEELKFLHDRFPNNIHLFVAIKDGTMIAGTLVFEYDSVVHTQYMAANDLAREIGALDLTISVVIDRYRNEKKWLDFGISTEHDRLFLNKGLISQKEGFGGRTGVYEIWEIGV